MTTPEIHQRLVERFGDDMILCLEAEALDPWIEVRADAIDQVAAFCKEELRFDQLSDLSAVDYFEPDPKQQKKFGHEPHLEVVYHCYSIDRKERLNLKVKLERWRNGVEGELPEVPSVAYVWAIADWHEREAYDLMGIRFTGHPNLLRILCPEDWVGHPLRKDYEFPLEYHGIRGK